MFYKCEFDTWEFVSSLSFVYINSLVEVYVVVGQMLCYEELNIWKSFATIILLIVNKV